MKLYKIIINKTHVEKLPEKDRFVFMSTMIMLNELSTLFKCMMLSYPDQNTYDKVTNEYQTSQTVFFLITLSGKIFEAWNLIKQNFLSSAILAMSENKFSNDTITALVNLVKYFENENNLLHFIRNKFAFHYDQKQLKNFLTHIPGDYAQEILIAEHSINCKYSTDVIFTRAIRDFFRLPIEKEREAIENFFKDVHDNTDWLIKFLNGWLVEIVIKSIGVNKIDVEIPDPPKHIILPCFINIDSNEKPENKN